MTPARPPRGSVPGTLAYWSAVAVVVAAITHLVSILALPYRSPQDAYARFAAIARDATMTTVAGPVAGATLPEQDPALASAFCLYDLRDGPVQVGLDVTGADAVMLSVYGRHGEVLYGLTNRSAAQNRLALTIVTAAQAAARAKGEDGTALGKVRVETDEPRGIVLAQALATAPSAMRQAQATASRLACSREAAPSLKAGVAAAQ